MGSLGLQKHHNLAVQKHHSLTLTTDRNKVQNHSLPHAAKSSYVHYLTRGDSLLQILPTKGVKC